MIKIKQDYEPTIGARFVEFELIPSDGTNYSIHLFPHRYGGIVCYVNDSSCYIIFKDFEVKHLFGINNIYTKKAIETLFRNVVTFRSDFE